jgi:tetratricopeptide (TPR) repeat protein
VNFSNISYIIKFGVVAVLIVCSLSSIGQTKKKPIAKPVTKPVANKSANPKETTNPKEGKPIKEAKKETAIVEPELVKPKSQEEQVVPTGYSKKRYTPKRIYQNITTRFNYYYNARLKLGLAVTSLKSSNKDDYEKLLPLYEYDTDGGGSIGGDMDEVVKKTSFGIQLHPISVWVPDCYLLMGKAYYFKKEYQNALDIFQFIQSTYKIKTVKGVPVLTPKYFHQPITNDALIWLIKTYVQSGKFFEADAVITDVLNRKDFPVKYKAELQILQTHLLIKRQNYKAAIKPLAQAIKETKNKKTKVRYSYILAQLNEYSNDKALAIGGYKQVIKMKPSFVMDYNARMKVVLLSLSSKNPNMLEVKSILMSMLVDKKFTDYYDAIYYQLGMIEINNKNEKQAIAYLKQSISVSTINMEQKGRSFKRLADIFYNKEQYILARNRYDSTLVYLPKEDEEYEEASARSGVLREVVAKIRIIKKEDSLQGLAKLAPDVLNKRLNKILDKRSQNRLDDSLSKTSNNVANTDNTLKQNNEVGSGFYFYNASAKASGYNDFIKKWGTRKLEDDWRRIKKDVNANQILAPEEKEGTTTNETNAFGNQKSQEMEKLLSEIPITPAGKEKSDNVIITSYYELALIYKDKLENYKKSVETLEKLLLRYPQNKYKVECFYLLYLLYDKLGNTSKSAYFSNRIIEDFPKSTFAKAIKNPALLSKGPEYGINAVYEKAYKHYTKGEYDDALVICKLSDTLRQGHALKPKYALLQALCIGKKGDLDLLKVSLNKIIVGFPNDPVKVKAEEILKAIDNKDKWMNDAATDGTNTTNKKEEIVEKEEDVLVTYKYEPNTPHLLVVAFNTAGPKNTTCIGQLSNYNTKNHSLDGYDVQQQMLGQEIQLVVIKTFKAGSNAQLYADELGENTSIFKGLKSGDYNIFIISQPNFGLLKRLQDVDEYINFYEEKY